MSILKSEKAVRILRIGVFVTTLTGLLIGLWIMCSGAANAATEPKPINLIEVGQKFVSTVHNGGDLAHAANTARDEAVAIAVPKPRKAIGSAKVTTPLNAVATPKAQARRAVVPTKAVHPQGFSLPMATQSIVDPVYGSALKLYDKNYFMPVKEQYAATDAPLKQVTDTVNLFTVQNVVADRGRCEANMSFTSKVACSSALVDANNGAAGVAPVQVANRYVPVIYNGQGCGMKPYGTNYCRGGNKPSGVVHISKSAMQYMAGNTGVDPSLGEVFLVEAHENGHRADDMKLKAQGTNIDALAKKGNAQVLKLENSADRHSGKTAKSAIVHGDLTVDEIDQAIAMIRKASSDADPTHGGPDIREGQIRKGMADYDTAFDYELVG